MQRLHCCSTKNHSAQVTEGGVCKFMLSHSLRAGCLNVHDPVAGLKGLSRVLTPATAAPQAGPRSTHRNLLLPAIGSCTRGLNATVPHSWRVVS